MDYIALRNAAAWAALKDAKLTEKDIPGLKAPAIKTLLLECISVVKGG